MFDLLILDSCYVMRRYFHAYDIAGGVGQKENGALYGLCKLFCWILELYPNALCAAVFDTGEPSFRKSFFKEYKDHREKTPEDFIRQVNIAHDLAEMFNASVFFGTNGYEA